MLAFIFEHLKEKIKPGQMASVVQIMLHWMLNPITSFTLKNFIATEFYHIQKMFWERTTDDLTFNGPQGTITVTNMDLQHEILYTMVKAIKHLRMQTEEGIEFFKKYPDGVVPQPEAARKSYSEVAEQKDTNVFERRYFDPNTNKVLSVENAFTLKENELVHANN